MAQHVQDDGFHEIQLNGKQLVFVFMAATVVSVVIFLCGVLVGRGVRGERTTSLAEAAHVSHESTEASPPNLVTPERPPTVAQPLNDPTKAPPPAPPNADGENSAAKPRGTASEPVAKTTPAPAVRPETPKVEAPKAEALKVDASKADAPKPDARKPEPAKAAAEAAAPKAADSSAAAQPVGDVGSVPAKPVAGIPAADDRQGWMVQVAATKTRGEADTMAKRLSAKGYSAFVLTSSPNVFRVRVGGYKSRGDAETVAAKLQKEERINPWVTR